MGKLGGVYCDLSRISVKSRSIKWELSSLVSAAIIAAHARSQSHSEPLSLETTQLLAKETAVPAKVNKW